MRLYIHIPFCTSKCGYCAFHSVVGQEALFEPYIRALCKDIESSLKGLARIQGSVELDSIFFGGGTPNLLPSHFYTSIFKCIQSHAHVKQGCEISLEANVNLINTQWCKDLLLLGANRLSIGIQSFHTQKLALLERNHSARDSAYGVDIAFNAGFKNLSCDLIIGTALDSVAMIESEIKQAAALPISHLSLYALSIDEGSRFAFEAARGRGRQRQSIASIEEELSLYARTCLQDAGFSQYEVSNYERTSRCEHNLGYWQGEEYLGCGALAVGRIAKERTKACKDLQEYIKTPTKRFVENLSDEDLRLERIMLGLRCDMGVCLEDIALNKENERVSILLKEGKCYIKKWQGKDYLVAYDLFLSDEITLWLVK